MYYSSGYTNNGIAYLKHDRWHSHKFGDKDPAIRRMLRWRCTCIQYDVHCLSSLLEDLDMITKSNKKQTGFAGKTRCYVPPTNTPNDPKYTLKKSGKYTNLSPATLG